MLTLRTQRTPNFLLNPKTSYICDCITEPCNGAKTIVRNIINHPLSAHCSRSSPISLLLAPCGEVCIIIILIINIIIITPVCTSVDHSHAQVPSAARPAKLLFYMRHNYGASCFANTRTQIIFGDTPAPLPLLSHIRLLSVCC